MNNKGQFRMISRQNIFSFLLVCLSFSLFISPIPAAAERLSITLHATEVLLENPITASTIDDAKHLLNSAFPDAAVSLNARTADVIIELPRSIMNAAQTFPASVGGTGNRSPSESSSRIETGEGRAILHYPDHAYTWRSREKSGRIVLTLFSDSPEGVSFGLYGLLQEKLGLRFIHPRQTIIPRYYRWPLAPAFNWKARPRFQKKGFHVHTLHPAELTEQLHNPRYPGALNDVKEYIDWLARNQQNVFQFFLLRDVDRFRWINHARAITEYAHSRGILAGVEVSLSMLQQKAFQLIKLLRPWPYTRQAEAGLSWLMRADWDFVTVDFSMGEYLPDLGRSMPALRDRVLSVIREQYNRQPMVPTHVIQERAESDSSPADDRSGILIHTVMCYSIEEPCAPVYGNENQRHMLRQAKTEVKKRETWYWPESAYWVAFDNSVPLLLLPYLEARFMDMTAVQGIGAEGHLTFSSGWEWGYWLIDWSIARWSWQYEENGRPLLSDPLTRLRDLFPDKQSQKLWKKALALQKEYLKDKGLMPFLSAADPSAEMFGLFGQPFAPRIPFKMDWLLNSATEGDVEEIRAGSIAQLLEYSRRMHDIVKCLRTFSTDGDNAAELTDALEVTALRAEHRVLTLRALIASRRGGVGRAYTNELLEQAASVRGRAMKIVRRQEQRYRYPLDLIASQRKDFTAYQFGYLYPVTDLHFWKREEEQVRQRRFDAFFMNIWNFRRVVGIESLVW